jgi:SsrA-binding protein
MKIVNKKAEFDYTILERLEAGVALLGLEVKSLRLGHAKLDGAYIRPLGNELVLVGAHIAPYAFARTENYDPTRTRRLLLHKKEILKITHKIAANSLTVIPLFWYTKGHRLKLEIGLAQGKKQFEKRDKLRKQAEKRDMEREFRGKVK